MAEVHVDDLTVDDPDAAGNPVRKVLRRVSRVYAIYRTDERLMIHYHDVAERAQEQRAALAPIAPLRGQICGLIQDWYSSSRAGRNSRAECYDQRVADALVIAFEGDVAGAAKLLEEIRDEIVGARTAWARAQYLAVAAGVSLLILLLLWFANRLLGQAWCDAAAGSEALIYGIVGGTIGAFFSIATGLRSRTVLTDLQFFDNSGDALLRMVIGAIAGWVLLCLITSGVVTMTFDKATLGDTGWLQWMIAGFVAGFSERMVPDLLAKAALVTTPAPAKKDAAVEAAAGAGKPAQPAAQPGAGSGTPDDTDSCPCDAPPGPGEALTDDAELPPSEGGVAASPPSPPPAPATN